MVPMALIWWIYHFWAQFWPYFNFVDFQAYFGPFSLVKSAKTKIFSQTSIFGLYRWNFFVISYNPWAWVVKRTKLNSKKVWNGTPYWWAVTCEYFWTKHSLFEMAHSCSNLLFVTDHMRPFWPCFRLLWRNLAIGSMNPLHWFLKQNWFPWANSQVKVKS